MWLICDRKHKTAMIIHFTMFFSGRPRLARGWGSSNVDPKTIPARSLMPSRCHISALTL